MRKMKLLAGIKNNLSQIFAIGEKNVKLATRLKIPLIFQLVIQPILAIILPLIIMGEIFTFADNFGPWDGRNFAVYQFTANQILLLYRLLGRLQGAIAQEKGQRTLTLLLLAPFRRSNLLFGIFMSHVFLISIPFMTLFILCYIVYPVSIITLFFIFFSYFLISLFFGGIGLLFAVFAVSKPRILPFISLPLTFLLMFSCLTMPFEFFPEYFQDIARLNPFYYIFSFSRYIWIEDNIILSITTHATTFLIFLAMALVSPIIGIKFFNYIFNKYRMVLY